MDLLMSASTTCPRRPARTANFAAVAGTAGHVEHAESAAHAARLDRELLPQSMDAERHEVVHQVVFISDRMKHPGDEMVLGRLRHFAVTEVRGAL
jgi:hypothetical protein